MTTVALKQMIVTPDGRQFETRAEALEHIRRPQIKTALLAVCNGRDDLAELLVENRESIADAFEIGKVRVAKKREKELYAKALDHAVEIGGKEFKFIADNLADLKAGFRWPKSTRMTDEEKTAATMRTLMSLTDNNEKLSQWIIANKDALFIAFDAGKVKREVNPKAAAGLAAYQAKKAAEKAAREAGEPVDSEAESNEEV